MSLYEPAPIDPEKPEPKKAKGQRGNADLSVANQIFLTAE